MCIVIDYHPSAMLDTCSSKQEQYTTLSQRYDLLYQERDRLKRKFDGIIDGLGPYSVSTCHQLKWAIEVIERLTHRMVDAESVNYDDVRNVLEQKRSEVLEFVKEHWQNVRELEWAKYGEQWKLEFEFVSKQWTCEEDRNDWIYEKAKQTQQLEAFLSHINPEELMVYVKLEETIALFIAKYFRTGSGLAMFLPEGSR